MAPRRPGGESSGGGGGGGSVDGSDGSGLCKECNQAWQFTSNGYKDAAHYAYLGLAALTCIVILVSLVMVKTRAWLHSDSRKERTKYWLFVSAALSSLLGLCLVIVDMILHLVEVKTTLAYWITFVFQLFGHLAGQVFSIAIIYKCLDTACEKWLPHKSQKILQIFHTIIVIMLSILAATSLVWYIRFVIHLLNGNDVVTGVLPGVEIGYAALAFVISIEILVWSLLIFGKASTRISRYLLLIIALALCIALLVQMIYVARTIYSTDSSAALPWAFNFVSLLSSIAIFVCLALLSRVSNRQIRGHHVDERFRGNSTEAKDYMSPSPYVSEENSQTPNTDRYQHGIPSMTANQPSLQSQQWKGVPEVHQRHTHSGTFYQRPQYTAVPTSEQR